MLVRWSTIGYQGVVCPDHVHRWMIGFTKNEQWLVTRGGSPAPSSPSPPWIIWRPGPPFFTWEQNSDFSLGSFLDPIFNDEKEVWTELDFPSYAVHCWPVTALLLRRGWIWTRLAKPFQPGLNIVIHEHQFHWPGWRLPFWGGWTWKGSLRGRLSSPSSWKCSPANPESPPSQIFSFSPPRHLKRPPAGEGKATSG